VQDDVQVSESGLIHHVELRVGDLDAASEAWGWLLAQLGCEPFQQWADGRSWRLGSSYLVIEREPRPGNYDRRGPGLSHLALHVRSRHDVDVLWTSAPDHGWSQLYADRHPWAGGPHHYAAFLENGERFKVELVAPRNT
jgi:catechol-2,3-dioxygenase